MKVSISIPELVHFPFTDTPIGLVLLNSCTIKIGVSTIFSSLQLRSSHSSDTSESFCLTQVQFVRPADLIMFTVYIMYW